jgi:hypothetical protein
MTKKMSPRFMPAALPGCSGARSPAYGVSMLVEQPLLEILKRQAESFEPQAGRQQTQTLIADPCKL